MRFPVGQPGREAGRDWVVFVHGAGGSSSIWYKQVRDFREHFNVLLIDLRGHPASMAARFGMRVWIALGTAGLLAGFVAFRILILTVGVCAPVLPF